MYVTMYNLYIGNIILLKFIKMLSTHKIIVWILLFILLCSNSIVNLSYRYVYFTTHKKSFGRNIKLDLCMMARWRSLLAIRRHNYVKLLCGLIIKWFILLCREFHYRLGSQLIHAQIFILTHVLVNNYKAIMCRFVTVVLLSVKRKQVENCRSERNILLI